jgi:hypothetical protein
MILVPVITHAQALTSFQSLANSLASLLNDGAILMITAALVVYFYGIVGNIWKMSQGEARGDELKKNLFWGIIILFFMVSIWGVIQFLQYTLFKGPPPAASSNGVVIYQN